jgi:hypothetical protein
MSSSDNTALIIKTMFLAHLSFLRRIYAIEAHMYALNNKRITINHARRT